MVLLLAGADLWLRVRINLTDGKRTGQPSPVPLLLPLLLLPFLLPLLLPMILPIAAVSIAAIWLGSSALGGTRAGNGRLAPWPNISNPAFQNATHAGARRSS